MSAASAVPVAVRATAWSTVSTYAEFGVKPYTGVTVSVSPSQADRTCVAGDSRTADAVAAWSSGWLNRNRSGAVGSLDAAPSTLLSTETRTPLDGLTAVP